MDAKIEKHFNFQRFSEASSASTEAIFFKRDDVNMKSYSKYGQ